LPTASWIRRPDKGIDVDWNLIFLALTLIPLVISVIGIVSYYTYGAASYAASLIR
jgi:hypothetical protein